MAKSRARTSADKALERRRNPGGKKEGAAARRPSKDAGPKPLEYSAHEVNTILFPVGQSVKLTCGDVVKIQPWSIKMFGEMAQRIPDTMAASMPDEEGNLLDKEVLATVFTDMVDEVVYMVATTIGWEEERVLEDMPFEELVAVATAVWDVCIAGPMGKIGGLMGRVMGTVGGVATLIPSKSPSKLPSSSPPSI